MGGFPAASAYQVALARARAPYNLNVTTYYLKSCDEALYRRLDDSNKYLLPEEVLQPDGWKPLCYQLTVSLDGPNPPKNRGFLTGPDFSLWTKLARVDLDEAQAFARYRGLPTDGW